MSGHAILDSCHNCGKNNCPLFVVDISDSSSSCGEANPENNHDQIYHHIHVFVACAECKKKIWDK